MKLVVKPVGILARLADTLMVPVMFLVSGTWSEAPQETHFWNNRRLKPSEAESLDPSIMARCAGKYDPSVMQGRWLFLFHIPLLGGWRNYVVLKPIEPRGNWYVGYLTGDLAKISRIPIAGPARMLIGSGDVSFFAIDAASGEQMPLTEIGVGRIGKGGPFAKVRLF